MRAFLSLKGFRGTNARFVFLTCSQETLVSNTRGKGHLVYTMSTLGSAMATVNLLNAASLILPHYGNELTVVLK